MSTIKTPAFDPCTWRGHSARGTNPVPCPATLTAGMIVSAKYKGKTTIIQLSAPLSKGEYQGRVVGFEPAV